MKMEVRMPRDLNSRHRQEVLVLQRVPAGVGGDGVVGVGDQGHLVGDDFVHEVHEGRDRIAFDIEFGRDQGADDPHVAVADVALVGARMDGDAFRPETLAVKGRFGYVGQVAAARIAQGRYLIDIYAQSGHVSSFFRDKISDFYNLKCNFVG